VKASAHGERGLVRRCAAPDPIEAYLQYVGIRLRDDRHVWGSAL
jgi:hypothetical protein